ncbi:hypothetical protein IVA95_34285 [Bradyrhizobium sp. 157]|uniref:hypothetical protein n=1 Tax=Bradyrhizobium sp. 157 TaxID=2782631 RepID=UPI001FF84E31|nr:hypothetical protein [Bradyrhizobium sp. 157]MCK1642489.1 hypothetical protein [Bradyrhizobium sp. 157]
MLEAVKSDPNANKLAYRLQYETQTAYINAHGGQRVIFCKDFIAANSQYKARFTTVVEDHMSDVSTGVQKAIAHNLCGAPPVKLSKVDWKPYAQIKMLRSSISWQGKDERLKRHRGNDGGNGTVLCTGKNPMSIPAANRPTPADASLPGSGGPGVSVATPPRSRRTA